MPSFPVTIRPLSLRVLEGALVVEAGDDLDGIDDSVIGVVRAPDSVTIVRRSAPGSPPAAAWRALYADAGHALDRPGVLVGVLAPLANAGIEVYVLSTIDRDLVLVPEDLVADAADALRLAGHAVAPID